MNYLAHAYLSFNHPGILTGNMISDYVKGKKKFDYSVEILKGINLHRAIDTFTDNHPATKEAKQFFKKDYRLYSGAFVDVVFDHFLAKDRNEFIDDDALKSFASTTYSLLQNDIEIFPERFQKMFPYMKEQNWLYNYQFDDMIKKSFCGLERRAVYLTETSIAFDIFISEYKNLASCYQDFFPSVKNFSRQYIEQSLNN
ncbi:MAG: ACP phosphodiesterase [Ferruginibacter sp.]